jgi:hypothetical protein
MANTGPLLSGQHVEGLSPLGMNTSQCWLLQVADSNYQLIPNRLGPRGLKEVICLTEGGSARF